MRRQANHAPADSLRRRVVKRPDLAMELEVASRRWHEAAEHPAWWTACTYISCALDREAAQRARDLHRSPS